MFPTYFKVLIGLLALAVVLNLSSMILDQESLRIDEKLRAGLTSSDRRSFVTLTDGVTHYELSAPSESGSSPVVVLIHGVSGPMIVWDKSVLAMNQAGLRTLRLDLYGRGFSDRPDTKYDLDLYIRQVSELLAALKITGAVDLVGHSMGAIISSEFTYRFPEKVRKLALVGPAGFPLQASPLAKLIQFPWIGDYLMSVSGDRSLHEHNRKYFFRPDEFKEYQERFESQLRIRGSKRAILSTFRNVPLQSYVEGFKRIGRQKDRNPLVVWGTEDMSFPFDNSGSLMQAIPGARLIPVAEAAHVPQYEKSELVNRELIRYLGGN